MCVCTCSCDHATDALYAHVMYVWLRNVRMRVRAHVAMLLMLYMLILYVLCVCILTLHSSRICLALPQTSHTFHSTISYIFYTFISPGVQPTLDPSNRHACPTFPVFSQPKQSMAAETQDACSRAAAAIAELGCRDVRLIQGLTAMLLDADRYGCLHAKAVAETATVAPATVAKLGPSFSPPPSNV